MGAFASWINHIPRELDGAYSASGGLTVASFDVAYPAANCLGSDPSKFTRLNYTRSATPGAVTSVTFNWSAVLNTDVARIITIQNVRVPSNFVSFGARVLNYLGSVVGTSPTIYTPANAIPISGTTDRYNFSFVLPANVVCAQLQLRIEFLQSTTDYFDLGPVWCGPAYYDPQGADREWTTTYVDEGQGKRAPGGGLAAQQLPRRIKIAMSLSAQSYEQAYGNDASPLDPCLDDMYNYCGNTLPIVVSPRDATPRQLQKHTVYGSITSKSAIKHIAGDRYITSLEVEQIR